MSHSNPKRKRGTRSGQRARCPRRPRRVTFEPLEPRRLLAPIISEFLASNKDEVHGLRDYQGTLQDWIEIYNPDLEPVDLTGWKLKDSSSTWTFPAVTLGPGEFRIVFASDKNLTTPELHTNFKLSRDPGEYLGLIDNLGQVVHEYQPAYPAQEDDISYGMGQTIEETKLVSAGDTARYWVPTDASLGSTWRQRIFNDGGWASGETGLGFANLVPGLAVWNYQANLAVYDLNVALDVIATPSHQSAVYTETAAVVNYEDTGGGGHFAPDASFPGMPRGIDHDDFVTRATGIIHIPATGAWTFGVNSDDGFRLRIVGANFDAAYGQGGTTVEGDTLEYFAPRAPDDSLGVVNNLPAGDYAIELVSYERGGGSDTELYAAPGVHTGWDGDFHLIGDVDQGGLEVVSQPFDGPGSGSTFASLIETDVKQDMLAAGNASLYSRITFDVADPAALQSLTLKMKYDDGYVAWLNGVEIARRNAPATLAYNSHATTQRTDSQSTVFENVSVSQHLGLLTTEGNVLAIQTMNFTAADGDLLMLPELAQIVYHGMGSHYFATPTPGAPNSPEYWHRVGDTKFSVDRGFHSEPFSLVISSDTAGATIRYSLNGTTPAAADNTKSVASITRTGTTATATIPGHGYAAGDWVSIRGATAPQYNGVFIIQRVTADTFDYTVAGSLATPAAGTITAQANYYTYTGPLTIDRTTTVRAAAFKAHYAPTDVDTQTYVFLDDILVQPAQPPGLPAMWNDVAADYQMDPDIVNDPAYRDALKDALLSLPTMSLVTDQANLFDPVIGIYANPLTEDWERPASLEYFEADGSGDFQINAGVRLYGGYGRQPEFKKHSLRVVFKNVYGSGKLDYPLFGQQATDEFDTFILRSNFNDGWTWGGTQAQFIRDQFADQSLLAMMSTASHGAFVHLYINGIYWGVYNPVERPDASFAASYLGGDKDDWDAINAGSPAGDSDMQPWYDLMNFDFEGGSTAAYQRVQGNYPDGSDDPNTESLLDVTNYIDYLLVNFFVCNADWPGHNWYAARLRGAASTGFKFFPWDTEMAMGLSWIRDPAGDMTGIGGPDSNDPAEPYYWLSQNDEFRMLFADRAHRHLFHDGALTSGAAVARYQGLADGVEAAVVTESARWGDVVSGSPYTQADWQNERDWILSEYVPQRNGALIQQLRARGLYPSVAAPDFQINGAAQHGGVFDLGAMLTITVPAGTVYYSLDGSDPRLPGGGVRAGAATYSGPITLSANTHVRARALVDGQWSALNEATYYVDLAPSIRITEIMYNPAPPTAAEIAAGYDDNNDFEFLEIKNTGDQTLPLGGLRFSAGVTCTIPEGVSIGAGQHRVLVRNEPAFLARYSTVDPTVVAGVYAGSLNNAGEQIELDAPVGGVIQAFDYEDDWFDHTDGEGFSLTIRDPLGELAQWDRRSGWRSSAAPGGTPGSDDALVTPGTVIINEVLAHQDAAPEDMIELHNTSGQPVNVGGWFVSDAPGDLTKYQIAANTWIAAQGYLVLTEDNHFGAGSADPGSRVPFALSEHGEEVFLSSNAAGVAGGYREHVDFGASPLGITIGLFDKSTGGTDFTLLETPTFGAAPLYPGAANSAPYRAPLVLNEIMYHPAAATQAEMAAGYRTNDFEFLELYNRSNTTQVLRDYYIGSGIGFTFGWYDADGLAEEAWTLEPGATATWSTSGLQGGTYEVLVRYDLYDGMGQRRDLDDAAEYAINSVGGTTLVAIDQDDDLFTYTDPDGWVSLGSYTFNSSGSVVLTRRGGGPSDWTIADQVMFQKVGHAVLVDSPTLASPWHSGDATALAPGEYLVLVSNYAAFDARYHVADHAIPVAGVFSGNLSDNGDAIKLFQLGDADAGSGLVPCYRVDYANFGDSAPWPSEPDGTGSPLNRVDPDAYGNDPLNWIAGGWYGTPGTANVPIDKSAPTSPSDVAGHVTVDPDTVTLTWTAAVDVESFVDHYVVYRNGTRLGTSATPAFADTAVLPLVPYAYAVSAVNRDGYESVPSDIVRVIVPGIASYAVPDDRHIELNFTEALTPQSATLLDNYVFAGGSLSGATLSANGLKVTLTTNQPLLIDGDYSVTIYNLITVSGNELRDGLQIAFRYAPQGSGFILREYWTGIGGALVSDLTGDPSYPDNPTGKTYPTSFESPIDWTDYYGTRMRGYVHPPTTGEYVFWLSSDNMGELWLSSDEDPAHAALIASVAQWTGSRQWDAFASQESVPVVLMAGRKYYIEALAKEHDGGDNLAVRWLLPGGQWEDPGDPGAPIPGIRLSQWGPVPDTSGPSAPMHLSADIIDRTAVQLSWAAATDPDSGVDHYVVYRDGQPYATCLSTSYLDSGAAPGARHRYEVSAVNSFAFAGELSATISVAPPGIVSVAAVNATTVQIVFTEPMDPTSAQQIANYVLSDGENVTAAVLQADRLSVWLTTTTLDLDRTYSVTVNHLLTAAGAALPAAHQATFYYGHGVLWEYWLDVGQGNAVADLTSSPNYPDNPSGAEYLYSFEAATNWQEAYGGRMRAYLTPAITGDYQFWIASDDNGELWLSTDSSADHRSLIAHVPAWTNSREWFWYPQQASGLVHLVAGTRYYIEALMKEGGGGDNLAVTWQRQGAPFDGLPIAGEYLTPYVESTHMLPVIPTVGSLVTRDTSPPLSGTIASASLAITVGVAGRYYAATRDGDTTWLLPDDAIAPTLPAGTHDISVCVSNSSSRTAFDVTTGELVIDHLPPTADVVDVVPDPRTSTVATITIVFSEPIYGLDVADLALSCDGAIVPLGSGQTPSTLDQITWSVPNLTELTRRAGHYVLTVISAGSRITDGAGNEMVANANDAWTTHSTVVGRRIFYNNSKWDAHTGYSNGDPRANPYDDTAIATDKVALVAGQKATFANYTNYTRGINGIMIDIANLAQPAGLTAADFDFRIGNTSTPANWPLLALDPALITISVRTGAGTGGSDRVTIVLPDSAVKKTWLQVTVKATAATGLAQPDVHYWGNAVADAGNSARDTAVNVYDALGVRANLRSITNPAPIHNRYDFNRDKLVNVQDELFVRANLTSPLTDLDLIDLRGFGGAGEGEGEGDAPPPAPRSLFDDDLPDDWHEPAEDLLLPTSMSAGVTRLQTGPEADGSPAKPRVNSDAADTAWDLVWSDVFWSTATSRRFPFFESRGRAKRRWW